MVKVEKIKIAIIENDLFYAESLIFILSQNSDLDVIGSFANPEDALTSDEDSIDILLLDLDFGPLYKEGTEFIKKLKEKFNSKIMVLTIYEDYDKVFNALKIGADGYILKSSNSEKILESIYELKEGGAPMSPNIARKITESFSASSNNTELLSKREIEIITLLSKGKMDKEVASELYISYSTVKKHISNIYAKLQVNTRNAAIDKYLNN
jgi:DNA-binding NarL/FixJ family response regulator